MKCKVFFLEVFGASLHKYLLEQLLMKLIEFIYLKIEDMVGKKVVHGEKILILIITSGIKYKIKSISSF